MTEQDKQGAFGGEAESGRVSDAQHTSQPTAKMTRKNKWIIVGVVAAVLVVAGAGFWVWHEQPSFCNAICHSPMDKYVETYYEGDPGKLVTAHAEAGDACLDCHEAEITTQVSEVMAWVSDSYPDCHNMTDVVNSTWGFAGNDEKYNPHSSHQDNNLECGDCHKVHETSTLYCAKCHDMNLPEGWEATNE